MRGVQCVTVETLTFCASFAVELASCFVGSSCDSAVPLHRIRLLRAHTHVSRLSEGEVSEREGYLLQDVFNDIEKLFMLNRVETRPDVDFDKEELRPRPTKPRLEALELEVNVVGSEGCGSHPFRRSVLSRLVRQLL